MNTKQLSNPTTLRVSALALALMAAFALISGCNESSFASAQRVVRAEDGQLTTATEHGRNEQTHDVAADAEVVLDGQPAALDELENGDAVKLTTEIRDGVVVVSKIEARSKDQADADKQAADPLFDPIAPTRPEQAVPQGSADPYRDAASDSSLPEESFTGVISSLGDMQFVVRDDSGVEHTFIVNDETKYTLDGIEATFFQLMVDHAVTVTAEPDGDNHVARNVDATSADTAGKP